ncbi:MAG: hypothetical protein LBT98_02880 [Puniceicoccales bacterium]|jgi:hypothetical protein|nr:hypothetical protein [Puniceicoccales bacterium]
MGRKVVFFVDLWKKNVILASMPSVMETIGIIPTKIQAAAAQECREAASNVKALWGTVTGPQRFFVTGENLKKMFRSHPMLFVAVPVLCCMLVPAVIFVWPVAIAVGAVLAILLLLSLNAALTAFRGNDVRGDSLGEKQNKFLRQQGMEQSQAKQECKDRERCLDKQEYGEKVLKRDSILAQSFSEIITSDCNKN